MSYLCAAQIAHLKLPELQRYQTLSPECAQNQLRVCVFMNGPKTHDGSSLTKGVLRSDDWGSTHHPEKRKVSFSWWIKSQNVFWVFFFVKLRPQSCVAVSQIGSATVVFWGIGMTQTSWGKASLVVLYKSNENSVMAAGYALNLSVFPGREGHCQAGPELKPTHIKGSTFRASIFTPDFSCFDRKQAMITPPRK